MTSTTTRRLRLDRNQLAKALNGDPEVVRQFELLLSMVNAIESGGGGTGAVDSVNGQTGVVVLDAGDVGADSLGAAAAETAALAATLADIATSGSADDLVAGTVPVARLPLTGVAAGSYTSTNLTVDATGRITAAASGAGGGGNSVTVTVNFGGSFTDKAQTVVTGQAWVTAATEIVVSPLVPTGVDPDEMRLLDFRCYISDRVVGDGFTLTVYSEPEAKGSYDFSVIGV